MVEVKPTLVEAPNRSQAAAPASPIAGMRVTAACILLSRVLGFLRDISTAALFGLGGVMDAFALAFRIPNIFRRLFGEGALSAAFIPALAQKLEESREAAWRLAALLLAALAVVLTLIVLLGEAVCALAWLRSGAGAAPEVGGTDGRLLAGLTAVMLPYLLFICIAAQAAAILQTFGRFTLPALAPTLLNICWLAGLWFIAPLLAPNAEAQAYALAVCVLVAGVLQLGIQIPALRRLGFRWRLRAPRRGPFVVTAFRRSDDATECVTVTKGGGNERVGEHADADRPGPRSHAERGNERRTASARAELRPLFAGLLPIVLGLAVTQINTLLDSLIAWQLARPEGGPASFSFLGAEIAYPLEAGAVASLYYGERMYQFPLGVFGVALGTVIYPQLARHAARGDLDALRSDLGLGMRLVLAVGIPASAGLVVLAAPLADLLLRHGALGSGDSTRAARVIACYSLGVWAYCALMVLTRAFYALGDRRTPLRLAACAVPLNLALNLLLVWPMAEAGLAVATAFSASVQASLLAWLLHRTHLAAGLARRARPAHRAADVLGGRAEDRRWGLATTLAKSLAATALMGAACLLVLAACPEGAGIAARGLRVAAPLAAGLAVYLVAAHHLGLRDLRLLWKRPESRNRSPQ